MVSLILCGGSGTRLWPVSRKSSPKQFVKIFKGESLFGNTLNRNRALSSSYFIATGEALLPFIEDEMEGESYRVLLEPAGRNTAPAMALVCMALDPEEIVLATPSDHIIRDIPSYEASMKQAQSWAEEGWLVTFGIVPAYAETGYGYIEMGEENRVLSFKEKPDRKRAEEYVAQGNCYWNSGMFCFKAGVFLEELKKHSPEVYDACRKTAEKFQAGQTVQPSLQDMMAIPSISVDYAVMEKSSRVKCVPSDMGWNDVGSFNSIYREYSEKEGDNVVLSSENDSLVAIAAKRNLVLSNKKTVIIDVDDLVIAETDDAILITKRESSQRVKEAVELLKGSSLL